MALEKELETYRKKLPELLIHEGKFVVIHGEEVGGIWDTYEEAITAAYRTYHLDPFMVKQIFAVEPIHFFKYPLPPCRS